MVFWVRYEHAGKTKIGTLEGEVITEYSGELLKNPSPTGSTVKLADVKLLAPIEPRNILALWNNFYERAAAEKGQIPKVPLYFMKPTNSVIGPGEPILQPKSFDGKVVHEAELGIVISKECREVSEADAAKYVFGYTCVNDVTAGAVLREDKTFKQWSRSKGFDSFTPIGPGILTDADPNGWRVQALVDGVKKQDYPVNDMIFTPLKIVSMISHYQTLLPGDVISCGTSLGASGMKPGNTCDIVIPAIGVLRNPFAADTRLPSKL